MSVERNRELLKELQSTRCRCGASKHRGLTFCRVCYYRLPRPVRNALYDGLGNGYAEAYDKATKILDESRPWYEPLE